MTTEEQKSATQSGVAPELLILMRHAKSDWGDNSLSDHDRPLNQRGLRDAPVMSCWIASENYVPDRVLSSSATRTKQTIRDMLPAWNTQPDVSFSDSLYLSSPETILNTICSDSHGRSRVMVLAHNPGISQLTSMLASKPIDMPTAAIAVFRVNLARWSELSSESDIELVCFMSPKSL